jgi:glyoxylase-like metal-dependent hydrolase (beta-lactamase superfamily II)
MTTTLTVKKLADNIWNFGEGMNDEPGVDAYLVTGLNRAVVIDTLAQEPALYRKVRELTSLPVDVLLTHGHSDHAGVSTKDFFEAGCKIYMHEADLNLPFAGAGDRIDAAWITPLRDGMIFDLGGPRLETILLPGHTPGSAVFLDSEGQLLFTGDGIGAGVFWMHIPGTLPLGEFAGNLHKLYDRVKHLEKLLVHPGHRHQAPIQHDLEFLADTVFVTDKILSGEMPGEERQMDFPGAQFSYRTVAYKHIRDYCYRTDNL